jgi:alkanesulfonate monooxygenase SsuD/methylene tetrahydromethanopterin reductase-like flavin-dependent oxidoreductase (luciferase family)
VFIDCLSNGADRQNLIKIEPHIKVKINKNIMKSNSGNNPSFCLEVWGTDYTEIKNACILAEKLGYDGFYYGESLADIDLDCWTIISNLSAITNKIKLGPVITYLLPQYRNIFLLAKQAMTVQQISNGRLEFRTGAGATLQWSSQWWHPYGIDYPNNAERVSMLEEGVQILHMLWNKQTPINFDGKYFKVKGVTLQKIRKNQKRIPLTIAAKRNKTMQIAAKYAEIWESSYITPEQFASLNQKFDWISKQISDNNGGGNRSKNTSKSIELDVIIADSDSELEYKKRIFAMERGPSVAHHILKHGLVGKPDKIAGKLKEYTNAGVDQFFLAFHDPFDHKALDLFMKATAIR